MNIQQIMQQAQVMQKKMTEVQAKLGTIEVQGQAGGGLVSVRATCKGEILEVTIDPKLIVADEKETLEDMVRAAINNTRRAADEKVAIETKKMMAEMGLPENFQLPGGF